MAYSKNDTPVPDKKSDSGHFRSFSILSETGYFCDSPHLERDLRRAFLRVVLLEKCWVLWVPVLRDFHIPNSKPESQ